MKIRSKITLVFFSFIVVIFVIVTIFFLLFRSSNERYIAYKTKAVEKSFSELKNDEIRILSAGLDVFTEDDTFKESFISRNREELYRKSKPLFDKLKNKFGISHFYYILPDGHCFLRVHNPGIKGDLITRATFKKCKKTKQMTSGLGLGKTAFALRTVMPYYYKGELIGYVEFAQEIDNLISSLNSINKSTTALVVEKKYLKREILFQ